MNKVPSDFVWTKYLELNSDVRSNNHFNTERGAIAHWTYFGRREGRFYKDDQTNIKYGYIKFPNFVKQKGCSSGFYSNYFFVLSMIIDAHNRGFKPYVNLDNTAFVEGYNPYMDELPKDRENTWDWWFNQEKPNDTDIIVDIPHSGSYFSHSEKVWGRNDLTNAKIINDTYIKIKEHILDEVNEYYNENFKGKVVLGVMARGAEMNKIHPEYGNQTIDTWIKSTKKVIKAHPEIDLIFLVTEESRYIPIYTKEFRNTVYMENVFRRTTETDEYIHKFPLWSCITEPRENHKKRLGEECLIQAKLLGMCNYLLVKQCGTSSAAILFAGDNLKDVIYT